MDIVEIQAIYYMVAATGVLIAAVFYVLNMRATLETRQAQLFMQLYNRWQEKKYTESKNFVMQYDVKNYEDYEEILRDERKYILFRGYGTFLEGLGVLVKRGLVDVTMIDDLMSGDVVGFWEKYRDVVREYRVRRNYPQALEWTEYLYDRIKPIAERQRKEAAKNIVVKLRPTF